MKTLKLDYSGFFVNSRLSTAVFGRRYWVTVRVNCHSSRYGLCPAFLIRSNNFAIYSVLFLSEQFTCLKTLGPLSYLICLCIYLEHLSVLLYIIYWNSLQVKTESHSDRICFWTKQKYINCNMNRFTEDKYKYSQIIIITYKHMEQLQ